MKILHTEASLGWGGQEIRTFNEALALRQKGHEIFFILQKDAKLAKRARDNGFVVLEISFYKKAWALALFQIIWFLKKHRIELVVTHSSLDAWIGGIAAKASKVPVVRIRHVSTPTRKGLNAKLLFNKLADFVITTSLEIVKPLAEASGKPFELIKCIPTGVDTSKIHVDPQDVANFKKSFGLNSDDLIVGSVCVVRSWKGIDTLIDAANLMRDEPQIKWLIVGGGYLEHHMQRVKDLGLQNTVIFTNHLDDPQIAMAALDVFLLLSVANEGISQASMQASYLSKPLVTTPTGGLKEVCLDQQTGIIVPIRSPEKVKEAINKLKDRKLRQDFGNAAKKHVIESFLFEKTLKDVENVYLRFSC